MSQKNGNIAENISREVLSAKLFSVVEEDITYTSGRKVKHHTVNRLPTVTILALTDKYELCLIEEYRQMLGKTVLAAPAGFMDKSGEKPLETAKRELEEEIGVKAVSWEQLCKFNLASSVIKGEAYLFLARDLTFGESRPEEDEVISMVKVPLDAAVKKVLSGEIYVAATMIGILLLDTLRKTHRL